MHTMTPESLRACIGQCWECRDTCQSLLYNHCLVKGGAHAERRHVALMTDCIQICQASADFMTRSSPVHMAVCAACAEVCDACAVSCEAIDCEEMRNCAMVCRACARSCREMRSMQEVA